MNDRFAALAYSPVNTSNTGNRIRRKEEDFIPQTIGHFGNSPYGSWYYSLRL